MQLPMVVLLPPLPMRLVSSHLVSALGESNGIRGSSRILTWIYSPDLSWRDIQHICVQTAVQINPDDPDWEHTAAGRPFSYKYGYGAIDGYRFVKAAQDWKLVKPQVWLDLPHVQVSGGTMDLFGVTTGGAPIVPGGVTSTMQVTQQALTARNFEKLEHINVKVWITHTRRGDVEVEIVSPSGVKSILAARRYQDADDRGFPGWTFMTVKHWSVIVRLHFLYTVN